MKKPNSATANQPTRLQNDRHRVKEDDLDVEDDEEHRREVEADGEALLGRRAGRDARLERDLARPCPTASGASRRRTT